MAWSVLDFVSSSIAFLAPLNSTSPQGASFSSPDSPNSYSNLHAIIHDPKLHTQLRLSALILCYAALLFFISTLFARSQAAASPTPEIAVRHARIHHVLLLGAYALGKFPFLLSDSIKTEASAGLFWFLSGALYWIFLKTTRDPHAPVHRSPFDIPMFGTLFLLFEALLVDGLLMLVTLAHESYEGSRPFRFWAIMNKPYRPSIFYSSRLVLPHCLQLLLRPFVKHVAGIQNLPSWLPNPQVPLPKLICEIILLTALLLPELAHIAKPFIDEYPRLAAVERALFTPDNPQALWKRRQTWTVVFWTAWAYLTADPDTILNIIALTVGRPYSRSCTPSRSSYPSDAGVLWQFRGLICCLNFCRVTHRASCACWHTRGQPLWQAGPRLFFQFVGYSLAIAWARVLGYAFVDPDQFLPTFVSAALIYAGYLLLFPDEEQHDAHL
ncbi:hypothetical protein B0H11DRAFT_2110234 [Mycena galericulata]|nr:hypothetical protein B0H11DRAFT_2110234 [Mycena galericulata]